MNILHISSDYPYTSLYRQMLMHLDNCADLRQTMYVPLRDTAHDYEHNDFSTPTTKVLYSKDFTRGDRLRYHHKRHKIAAACARQVQVDAFDIIHAHYLFSAGGVAVDLARHQRARLVVAVRNTDVNIFRRMIHLRSYGIEVLRQAHSIVFISPSHRDLVIKRYVPKSLRDVISTKTVAIPNGMDDFWLDNQPESRRDSLNSGPTLLFVGEFTRNKNIEATIAATELLRARRIRACLTLVGDGPHASKIAKLVKHKRDFVSRYDWTTSKTELLSRYRNADILVMASFRETFGLAYIEALSQGLPIVHSRGQGIDGYLPEGSVGYGVDPSNAGDIADAVARIISDYEAMSERALIRARDFRWSDIASTYLDLYARVAAG